METLRHALINYMVLYIIVAAIITSGTRYLFAYNVRATTESLCTEVLLIC